MNKILIIDDDLALLKMLTAFLSSHGYTVLTAVDGEEGLAQVNKEKPNLIVLDVQMPKMNGYTFLFELHKIPYGEHIPIIVLTAKEGMAEIFRVEGVKQYMTKPFQPEVLAMHIKKYVQS